MCVLKRAGLDGVKRVVDEGCCLARSARYGAGLDGVKRVVDEGCCIARSVWSGAGRSQEGC